MKKLATCAGVRSWKKKDFFLKFSLQISGQVCTVTSVWQEFAPEHACSVSEVRVRKLMVLVIRVQMNMRSLLCLAPLPSKVK